MNEKNVKLIRKQLRNVCQELFPQVLNNELVSAVNKTLTDNINVKLKALSDKVEQQLEEMNVRTKDTQAYVVKQLGVTSATTELPKVSE